MRFVRSLAFRTTTLILLGAITGRAQLLNDQNVTSNVIYGSGNSNGSFTVNRVNGIELGMRAHLRFDATNQPQNIFNSNGDGTFTFSAGTPTGPGLPGWVTSNTPFWNIDWSINTDYDGAHPARKLGSLTYRISMDFNAGPGTLPLIFDPVAINSSLPYTSPVVVPFWDHAIGDNSTAQSGGASAGTQSAYSALIASKNLAQNSWSPEFFNDQQFSGFNPLLPGRYDFYLSAIDSGVEVARTSITVIVVVPLAYNQNVTPDAIYGNGNANGSFTTARIGSYELGMRGKLRFPSSNIFKSNGDGTYTFNTGSGTSTFPHSEWAFDWSVNTDRNNTSGLKAGDLTYKIGMDNDPGAGTNYLVFDPVSANSVIPYTSPFTMVFWDNSMGNNSTANGAGLEATNLSTYMSYLTTYNVAQNSWQPTFFQNTAPYSWNPNTPGRYEYYLAAYRNGAEVDRTSITIIAANGSTLLLEADTRQTDKDTSLAGDQVRVKLYMRNLASAVTGYQAFLAFDPSKLTYVPADSSYSASPFSSHVQSTATANVGPGQLRLDGSSFSGSTTADSLLATLVFTATSECTPAAVTFDLTQAFPSVLSNAGSPVATSLVDGPAITADSTAPVIGAAPDVTAAADANVGGGCSSAVVSFPTPTAFDNCDGSVPVTCYPPSGSTFPVGQTTVTCVASDATGNTSLRYFTVTVTATNVVQLSVQLVGVTGPVVRCIHFQTDSCSTVANIPLTFNGAGVFTGTIQVPCGSWTTLCAKDQQHTEWATTRLSASGATYLAGTTLQLKGGDTDNDGDVDIHDVTWLIAQFGQLTAAGGCPYNGVTRDADFSDNGAIGSEDYSFLVANWLTTSACNCTLPDSYGPGAARELRTAIEVHDTISGAADLNHDGLVDYRDVKLFETNFGLPHQLSEAVRLGQPATK